MVFNVSGLLSFRLTVMRVGAVEVVEEEEEEEEEEEDLEAEPLPLPRPPLAFRFLAFLRSCSSFIRMLSWSIW